jgi:hypothetical protein
VELIHQQTVGGAIYGFLAAERRRHAVQLVPRGISRAEPLAS